MHAPFSLAISDKASDGCRAESNVKDQDAMNIRPTKPEDIPALKDVLDTTGLFPSEILPEMVSDFLDDPASVDLWLTCESDGEAV